MIANIHNQIHDLETQINSLVQYITNVSPYVQERNIDTAAFDTTHEEIYGIYQDAMEGLNNLSNLSLNEEETFEVILKKSELENKANESYSQFKNQLITFHPAVTVNETNPCIHAKVATSVDTKNTNFLAILKNYPMMRKIQGDGNCFLSGFIALYLEKLVDENKLDFLIQLLQDDKTSDPSLIKKLQEMVEVLKNNPTTLHALLSNNGKIFSLIAYFRQLAANEMLANKAQYEPIFQAQLEADFPVTLTGLSFEELIKRYVIPMGMDFSHAPMTALCKKIGFHAEILDETTLTLTRLLSNSPNLNGVLCRYGRHYFVLYPTPIEIPPAAPVKDLKEISVTYKLPFGQNLFLFGQPPHLSWGEGIPLIQIDEEKWIFHSKVPLPDDMEYKFRLDTDEWESIGENRKIIGGNPSSLPLHFNTLTSFQSETNPVKGTRITVQWDPTQGKPMIRGNGPGLENWSKEIPMKYVGADIWVWDTTEKLVGFEYKILVNRTWESGNNHIITSEEKQVIIPLF